MVCIKISRIINTINLCNQQIYCKKYIGKKTITLTQYKKMLII